MFHRLNKLRQKYLLEIRGKPDLCGKDVIRNWEQKL